MVSVRSKVASIIALSVLTFLMSALLINIFEVTYLTLLTPQRLWRSCDGEEICSESTSLRAASNMHVALDGSSLRKYYDEMIRAGLGRRAHTNNIRCLLYWETSNGTKTDISLVSAFEHPEQIYVMMTSQNRFGDTMYCRYFDHKRKEMTPAFKTVVYPEFTANCVRREGAKYMSLTESPEGSYELQGATYFYIYLREMDEYSRKLLDYYVRTGEAEVTVLHDRYIKNYWEWQFAALQDCLIRARGHSRWVAMIDLDERLTTTEYNGTLIDFLQNISDPKIGAVSLRQRWVLRNETTPEKFIDENQVAELMPTWRYHNTSHVAEPGHVAKYIVDPMKAISVEVHFVEKFFDGYTTYYMKPEEAVIRHYRNVYASDWGKHWLKILRDIGEFSLTDYPEAHMTTLRENVQRRLHHVYGGKH